MSLSANQPVAVGQMRSTTLAPRVQEREPGRAEQVLENAGREEVDVELAHVERERAGGLVRVENDERAALVRDPRDLGSTSTRAPFR